MTIIDNSPHTRINPRMFDQNFMAGLIVLFATFAGAIWVASALGIDPTIALVIVALASIALFVWLERRTRGDLPPARPTVFVPWGDKLNATDFRADAPETFQSLVDMGPVSYTHLTLPTKIV